ncbi:LytTR family DNA-binding domain-containing protein [Roseovarius aestuarii]|nr:LytTR family DNA-binding domain-containing protein [Roseovarius aestuarii]
MSAKPTINQLLRDSYRRVCAPLTIVIAVTVWILASVGGPFGTFEAMSLFVRAWFWGLIVVSAVFIGYGARAMALLSFEPSRMVLCDVVATLIMTVTLAPVVWGIGTIVQSVSNAPVPPISLVLIYIFVTSAPIFALRRFMPGFEPYGYFLDTALSDSEGEPRLLQRLPAELRGEVLRLSTSGHFTEVVTTQGTHTLRLRMADAIGETDPVVGLSTHRSHWVAEAAIQGVERENPHRIFLVLANEDRVPVSRSYRPELAARGLLE